MSDKYKYKISLPPQQLKIQIEFEKTNGILVEPKHWTHCLEAKFFSETNFKQGPILSNLLSMTKMFLADPFIAVVVRGLRPESTLACFHAFQNICCVLVFILHTEFAVKFHIFE